MLIKLKNFRCHGSETACEYTFDESGLVLLSGASGSGKSTLLKAIIYALYGKVRKPYSFGAKTCSVTLEFMDMVIFRSSNPNRLIVNGLEDEPAQHFIDERIGMNYTEFMLSSYIPQKNNTSLLSMSQADQIEAIKMLAFKDGNMSEALHKKAKAAIKQLGDSVTSMRSKVEFARSEVATLSENLVKVDFPLKLGESETETDCIRVYRERIKTFGARIAELHDEKTGLKKSLTDLQTAQDQIDRIVESRDVLKKQIDDQNESVEILKAELAEFPIDLDQTISKLKKYIKCLEKRESLEALETNLKASIEAEIASRKAKIDEIDKTLWIRAAAADGTTESVTAESISDEIFEIQAILKKYEDYCSKKETYTNALGILEIGESENESSRFDADAISNLQHMLLAKVNQLSAEADELRAKKTDWAIAEDRLKLEKERVVCPKCNAGLRLCNGELVCMEVTVELEDGAETIDYQALSTAASKKIRLIESEKKGIQTLYTKIETIGDIPDIPAPHSEHLDDLGSEWFDSLGKKAKKLTKFLNLHTDMAKQRAKLQRELDAESFGATVKTLRDTFARETRKFEELLEEVEIDPSKMRDDLEAELAETQELKTNRTVKLAEITEAEKTLKALNDKFLSLVKQLVDLNHKLSGINRSTVLKKIERVEKKIERATVKQSEDTAISEQVDGYLMYVERLEKLNDWKLKYDTCTAELADLESQLAGFLTLKTLIAKAEVKAENTVIETINEHTSYYLDTFFTEHKMTAIIETSPESKFANVIDFKGNQYSSINELSGGEFDRVTLASVCGINSMLNSPILLLDESLASLDSDTNTEIISFLKELSENKLILVCSHEAVTGIFDEIVRF